MPRYFAYGSNLDIARMTRRCPGVRVVGVATLAGHRLRFAGRSRRWGAAVATVVPDEGAVTGLLYDLSDDALVQLDRFEGAPASYQRTQKKVLGDDGLLDAWVYKLPPDAAPGAPDPDYVRLIVQGLRALGADVDAVLEATWALHPPRATARHRVFVYGTLLARCANASCLNTAVRLGMGRTEPEFSVVELEGYPGLFEGGTQSVFGEIYAVDDATLDALDVLEETPLLYRRARRVLVGGREVELYLSQTPPTERVVTSGDWRWHLHREEIRAH